MGRRFFTADKKIFYPIEEFEKIFNEEDDYDFLEHSGAGKVIETILDHEPLYCVVSDVYTFHNKYHKAYVVDYDQIEELDYRREFKIFLASNFISNAVNDSMDLNRYKDVVWTGILKEEDAKLLSTYEKIYNCFKMGNLERKERKKNEKYIDYLQRIERILKIEFDYS